MVQSLEKTLAELAGIAGVQSAEQSAAMLLAQVRAFEAAGGIGGSPITVSLKTVDQTTALLTHVHDNELEFAVEAGHLYSFRDSIIFDASNDVGEVLFGYAVPAGVTMQWGIDGGSSVLEYTEADDVTQAPDPTFLKFVRFIGFIDATAAGGDVYLQYRNPDATTSGDMTVKKGSFIELIEIT